MAGLLEYRVVVVVFVQQPIQGGIYGGRESDRKSVLICEKQRPKRRCRIVAGGGVRLV